ncbi:hypothetical protein BDU57DRAFT_435871, partial [Ampelomyces quisqualis]
EVLLNFISLYSKHIGVTIVNKVAKVLYNTHIIGRLLAITIDSISNNTTLRRSL